MFLFFLTYKLYCIFLLNTNIFNINISFCLISIKSPFFDDNTSLYVFFIPYLINLYNLISFFLFYLSAIFLEHNFKMLIQSLYIISLLEEFVMFVVLTSLNKNLNIFLYVFFQNHLLLSVLVRFIIVSITL